MPTKSTEPGWLPVVGGPLDGAEFYPHKDLKPSDQVRLWSRGADYVLGKYVGIATGFYWLAGSGKVIAWIGY